jgi:predicted flap endonuclease-1-like 5' DNA nuclease
MTAQTSINRGRPLVLLIIGLGVVMIAIAAFYTLGNIAETFLSFSLTQVFWVGVFTVITGLLMLLLGNGQGNFARTIVTFIIIVGAALLVIFAAYTFLNLGDNFLTFTLPDVFWLGLLWLVVGIILSLFFRDRIADYGVPPAGSVLRSSAPPAASKAAVPAPAAPKLSVPAQSSPAEIRAAAPSKADDLTIIEGIGPKSAEALRKSGITSFAQLANMSAEEITRIVKVEHKVQIVGDPGTWAKQARYLADGDREGFERYAKRLIAGREPDDN